MLNISIKLAGASLLPKGGALGSGRDQSAGSAQFGSGREQFARECTANCATAGGGTCLLYVIRNLQWTRQLDPQNESMLAILHIERPSQCSLKTKAEEI